MRKREYIINEIDFAKVKALLDGAVFWKKFADKVRIRLAAPNKTVENILETLTQNKNL